MDLMVLVCLLQVSAAQEEAKKVGDSVNIDSKITTRVTLTSSSGTPGTSVVVPLYFTPAQGLEVGRLRLDVKYVSVNLKFAKLDSGLAAELSGVNLHTELKEGKNEKGLETQTLVITASFLSSVPPQKGIPEGVLGYITLRVEKGGRPASIGLRVIAKATELGTNNPVANLRVFDAKVDILAPGTQPQVTCFIFSH